MTIDNARRFVDAMRQDKDFRARVLETRGPQDFSSFLQEEGLAFNQRELVEAMAECMQRSESG